MSSEFEERILTVLKIPFYLSCFKSTTVTLVGTVSLSDDKYKVNLPQNDQKTTFRHTKYHVLYQTRHKAQEEWSPPKKRLQITKPETPFDEFE